MDGYTDRDVDEYFVLLIEIMVLITVSCPHFFSRRKPQVKGGDEGTFQSWLATIDVIKLLYVITYKSLIVSSMVV